MCEIYIFIWPVKVQNVSNAFTFNHLADPFQGDLGGGGRKIQIQTQVINLMESAILAALK